MSADIQEPHLSLNVSRSREDQKNKGKKEESQVEIYENEDTSEQSDLGFYKVRPRRHNNLSAVHRSHFTIASILGVLYLLILAGIYMLYILATLDKQNLLTERDQVITRNINLTEERDELQTKNDILKKEKAQLAISLNRAQTINTMLTAERDGLQTLYDILIKSCQHTYLERP